MQMVGVVALKSVLTIAFLRLFCKKILETEVNFCDAPRPQVLNLTIERAPLKIGDGEGPRKRSENKTLPLLRTHSPAHLTFFHPAYLSPSDCLRTLPLSSRRRQEWLPAAGALWCLLPLLSHPMVFVNSLPAQ